MNITLIAGARPNFMKVAPIIHAMDEANSRNDGLFRYRLIHTGQHYDKIMSDTFFEELNIPHPDANLGCGGGSQAEQTAAIMVAFEKELQAHPADLVMVVGDVTSTMACSIVARKLNTKVAHVEAGIRSFDLSMPEEINRMVTDSITDVFFTTSEWAGENLRKSGVKDEQIHFTGNVMIDTLLANRHKFTRPEIWDRAGLEEGGYLVMTLHRPANVDEKEKFARFLEAIIASSGDLPLIFPVHPRTAKIIRELDVALPERFHMIEPLGYLEFNYLVERARAVLTDSGGITEEATVMGVPCMTLRDNTERPETVELGTNELIGTDPANIAPAFERLLAGQWKSGRIPDKWDGKAAGRIVAGLEAMVSSIPATP
ncbi:non-hydrolyzing UDP-N-acetylglucosamine 2-epimerase [Natronogracilivirga saccharolytica]|uniref:UDP-N-acetylglucosamine 2-epimerase (Non-hydrolyzing) n=1 Tax=Natronogracilivirga saccharolytica TaxID=2812953 RepID=A0A8J7RLE5_9BACT|nr:UDP-N-acetylglucosamine 2-epimerase (non-hydrolyzing) [Natronogracilivirga saccharolytica]MBP3193825.1 UDP-N-acetylglucosamine 2-epimerase (non-hydrolyzing) [Natronogracilivirga saccharolytica]